MSAVAARHLLVVYHSRSGGTQALADAAIAGATNDEIDGVEVRVRTAFDATIEDVRWCDGIVLGTPENFGYMSGALKDFFERIYYTLLEAPFLEPMFAGTRTWLPGPSRLQAMRSKMKSALAHSVPEACSIACAGRTALYEAIRSGASTGGRGPAEGKEWSPAKVPDGCAAYE